MNVWTTATSGVFLPSHGRLGRGSGLFAVSLAMALLLGCTDVGVAGKPQSTSVGNAELVASVAALEAQAQEALGVGIVAWALLAEAEPENLFLADALEDDGRMHSVEQLQDAGLISVAEIESAQGRLLQLTRTETGNLIAEELR